MNYLTLFQEFDSQEPGVSSVHWVMYFASRADLLRHKEALMLMWRDVYQVGFQMFSSMKIALIGQVYFSFRDM